MSFLWLVETKGVELDAVRLAEGENEEEEEEEENNNAEEGKGGGGGKGTADEEMVPLDGSGKAMKAKKTKNGVGQGE